MTEHGVGGEMSLKNPFYHSYGTRWLVRSESTNTNIVILNYRLQFKGSRAEPPGDQRHQTNVPKLLLEGSVPAQLQCQWIWQCLLPMSSTKSGWKVFTPRKKEIKIQQIKKQPTNNKRSRDHFFNNSTFVSLPFLEVLKTGVLLISSRSSCT